MTGPNEPFPPPEGVPPPPSDQPPWIDYPEYPQDFPVPYPPQGPPPGQPYPPQGPPPGQPYPPPGPPPGQWYPPPVPYPGPYPPAPLPHTNSLATASLVTSALGIVVTFMCWIGVVIPVTGVALGIVALTQINRTGQDGRALAVLGIVIGTVPVLLTILAVLYMVWTASSYN